MKSSFILSLVLCASFCSVALAQQPKKAAKVKKSPTKPVTAKPLATKPVEKKVSKTDVVEVPEKDHFQKFYDRLAINYFSAFQSSSFGQFDTSPVDEGGRKDTSSGQYLFNQISFNYNFGWKMNFVMNPRFSVNFSDTKNLPDSNNGAVVIEDALMGFQGVILSSDDKKFNFWLRAGLRLPTSRASRAPKSGGQYITTQPEFFGNTTYDFNKTWQLAAYIQLRQWIYDNKISAYRYRAYFAPYIQYSLNDTTRLMAFYEVYLENRQNLESQNGKKPLFQDYWQNIMLGVSHDFTPTVNFMPFIGYFIDTRRSMGHIDGAERYHHQASTGTPGTRNIRNAPLDPAWLGFWLSWKIK